MAAMVVVNQTEAHIQAGQGGYSQFVGQGAFTTSGTSCTIAVPTGGGTVFAVLLTPEGTPNANEPLSYSVSGSTVTVTRAAGTTSGLKFSFLILFR